MIDSATIYSSYPRFRYHLAGSAYLVQGWRSGRLDAKLHSTCPPIASALARTLRDHDQQRTSHCCR